MFPNFIDNAVQDVGHLLDPNTQGNVPKPAQPQPVRTTAPKAQAPVAVARTTAPGKQPIQATQQNPSLASRAMSDINSFANSNLNPTHDVGKYLVNPVAQSTLGVGTGIVNNAYNHGIAPIAHLPKESVGSLVANSKNQNLKANVNAINTEGPKQQAENALNLASYALPGGGKVVEDLAEKAAAPVAEKVGAALAPTAGKIAGQAVKAGVRYAGNAALGGATGYGLGASNTLLDGGSLSQANKTGVQSAKLGAVLGDGGTIAADAVPKLLKGTQTAIAMGKNLGIKPPTNLTPAEITAATKILHPDTLGITFKDLTSQDAKLFYKGQQKLGVEPGTAAGKNAMSDALTAHTAFNTAVAQRQLALEKLLHPTSLNEGGYVKNPLAGNTPEDSETLKHFTTPEVAKQLKTGAEFDYSKNPVHGMGGKDSLLPSGSSGSADKFVTDGGPALYLSRDDKTWSKANVPTGKGEVVSLDKFSADDYKPNGTIAKQGITPQYDYAQQKYVGVKNATKQVSLSGVDYHIDPSARRLVIDSPAALDKVIQQTGQHPDSPQFWAALRQKYDVVDIKSVSQNIKSSETDSRDEAFFRSAKADQSIVLNPKVASTKPGIKPTVQEKPTATPKLGTSAPKPSQPESIGKVLQNKAASKLDSKAYGRVFNVPEHIADRDVGAVNRTQLTGAQLSTPNRLLGEALAKSTQDTADARVRNAPGYEAPKLTAADRRVIINGNEGQQTKTQIPITVQQGNTKGAVVEANGIAQERLAQFRSADRIASKLSKSDQKLLSERNDPSVKMEPKNPALFAKAAAAYDKAYDYSLAADRAAGSTTLRYGSGKYTPLYLKATPEKMDELGIKPEDRIQGKYTGFRTMTRKYKSYADAESRGLKPLYKSPLEDAKHYATGGNTPIRNNLLAATLRKSNPEDIADAGAGFEQDGKTPFKQAAGTLPFYASKSVNKELNNFKEAYEPKSKAAQLALKGVEKASNVSKAGLFLGSPFHVTGNVIPKFAGTTLASGHVGTFIKGLGASIPAAFSKDAYGTIEDNARTSGAMEYAQHNGLALGDPKSYINRVENTLGLKLAELAGKNHIMSGTPEATKLFHEYNNVITKVNASYSNMNPTVEKAMNLGSLAPGYLQTQGGLLKDAVNPKLGLRPTSGTQAGGVARGAVLGQRALEGITAVLVSAIATKQAPTLKKFINEFGLNPNNPIPNAEIGQQTKPAYPGAPTKSQVTELPTDPLGLAAGLATDPSHFTQSRLSPAASFVEKVATNKNWNGDPLADPNLPKGQYIPQLVKNAAINSLVPIGVQNVTNLTKSATNPNIRQGIAQEFGTRLKTNPNDPTVKADDAYYAAYDKALASLPAGSQEQGAFLENYGVTKDPTTGKYLMTPNSEQTVAKTSALNAYPAANAAATKMNLALQKQGQKIDPYYNLTPAQQKAYNSYETMAPLSADRTDWLNKNSSWYNKFSQSQTNYFNSLPAGNPNRPTNPIKYPNASASVTSAQTAYDKIATTDTVSQSAFLNANPALVNQWADQTAYDNAVRVARGYAAVKQDPSVPAAVNSFMTAYDAADKATRSSMRTDSPAMYQSMIGVYDNDDLGAVAKQAAVSQLQGEPDYTNKELTDLNSVASDIYQTGTTAPSGATPAKPTYSIVPAGWMGGLTSASGGSSSSSSSSSSDIADGYPVFKAPTSTGDSAFKTLASILKSDTKVSKGNIKQPSLKLASYKASPMKLGKVGKGGHGSSKSGSMKVTSQKVSKPKAPKSEKNPKPYKSSSASIDTSSSSGQRIKLSV